MSISQIFDSYSEFQAILTNIESKYTIKETLEVTEIKIDEDITLTLLKKLNEVVNSFEIFCNPFPYDCNEIIGDLESSSIDILEIESITILLEKNSTLEDMGNLNYYFLDKYSAIESIKSIGNYREGYKINIGIPYNESIETDTIVFISLDQDSILSEIPKKYIDSVVQENINFYLSNNKNSGQNYYYNPYSFKVSNNVSTTTTFFKLIQRNFYYVMLECLSDKIEDNNFVLRGEKTISIAINNDFNTDSYPYFINIFTFLVSIQKYTEKFIIIKKVFSLYVMDQESISDVDNKLSNIWKTINHYYDHYVEDNIKDFFKTKDQLLKEAMNVSKVIYEQTDKINTSIVASLLSIIIIIATTLYRSIDSLTVTYFATLLIIFIIFSVIYYYLMNNSSEKRFQLTKKQFQYFIQEITLMQKKDIADLEYTYLESPYLELRSTLYKLLFILIFINALMVVSFLIFLCIKKHICFC
ncbi:hypothetical protein ACFPRA_22175 [Sporosarcina soli]|uniref:Uncharacterized protein n=1 Tax=Sporosarcina soli TaxID=334736 RepID=A0ABW0TQ15_9BACL